jgi:hypothetical protein
VLFVAKLRSRKFAGDRCFFDTLRKVALPASKRAGDKSFPPSCRSWRATRSPNCRTSANKRSIADELDVARNGVADQSA